ncbi:hypothetical protein EJ08DRAFT_686681, partial [Tothia fuscella]
MPRGRPRGRIARAVSAATRTPTPAQDEEMEDVNPQTPQNEEEDEEEVEQGDTPAADSNQSSPRPVEQIPRKRLGRPPKNRPPGWDTPDKNDDRGSEVGIPGKRKRGRPAGSGTGFRGRGTRPSIPQGPPMMKIDKEGNMAAVVNDEADLPEDEEGEEKIDKLGNLKGGRDYRVRVFTIKNRGKRLYMLSTEPARCCGFRDSYLFFTKHLKLHKVIVDDDEKRELIDREVIPHSYKGRAIGVVTARSVFREFGAKIVIGGKYITDDYYIQQSREAGHVEGELADPGDVLPPPGEPYNKNQYVAWHGASAVYHTGAPTVPMANGKPIAGKRKLAITSSNWQIEHARAASRFNSVIAANRKKTHDGIYDPHTNIWHYPKIMQPTHVKWEQLPIESSDEPPHGLTNGISHLTNGVDHVNLNGTNGTNRINEEETAPTSKVFSPLPPVIYRNYLVVDTKFESPPISGLGLPGPDGDAIDVGPNGLPQVTDDILAELPPDCRKALLEAKAKESQWKQKWGTEVESGARGNLKIGFLGYPV